MSNVKVSELPLSETISDNDFILASIVKGDGSYDSKKVKVSRFKESVVDITTLLSRMYPVGSVYTTIQNTDTCPLGFGTWTKIAEGKCLFGVSGSQTPGSSIEAGLPNISASATLSGLTTSSDGSHTHTYVADNQSHMNQGAGTSYLVNNGNVKNTSSSGSHTHTISGTGTITVQNQGVYGKSTTVQPPAIAVIFWKRTA